MQNIKFKKTEEAKKLEDLYNLDFTPTRATTGSSGFDLFACIKKSIEFKFNDRWKIPTGVHIWIGDLLKEDLTEDVVFAGFYLPRSSSKGLKLVNTIGLLDSDYQDESFIFYENPTEEIITINPGDKIAQLVIIPTWVGKMEEDSMEWELTERIGGFGSTDIKVQRDTEGYVIPPSYIKISKENLTSCIVFNELDNETYSIDNNSRKENNWWVK